MSSGKIVQVNSCKQVSRPDRTLARQTEDKDRTAAMQKERL